MNGTGVIILAAGNSSRLGHAKQLLLYKEKTLIEHVVDEALSALLDPVIVVTGANAEQVIQALSHDEVEIVFNPHWEKGMASGIVLGITKLQELNIAEDVIVAVCDQPFVSKELFQQLIDKKVETGKGIIACSYADTIGTPVLFSHKYFEELSGLKGEDGAKKLLKTHKKDVALIEFPQGSIDIDTQKDYQNLLKRTV